MLNRKFFLSLALLCLFVCAGGLVSCDDGEKAHEISLHRREELQAPAGQEEAVTYAYLPQYAHALSFERHQPLIAYLSQATGVPFRQVFPRSFEEHVEMFKRGEIDISFSNPFIYVKLAENGAKAFARVVEEGGTPDFRGQIIVRGDNRAITTIEDVRGKGWIAVDPLSAGGFLFPLGFFLERGIRPEDFREIAFAPGQGGKQENVVMAVYTGRYDIGTIREGTLDVLAERIDTGRLRVLAETPAYPGWVYAVRSDLDPKLTKWIGDAMFRLDIDDPAHAAILKAAKIEGIIPATDEDYDPVRRLVKVTATYAEW